MKSHYTFNIDSCSLNVTLYGADVVRVTYGSGDSCLGKSLVVTAPCPEDNSFGSQYETEHEYVIETAALRIRIAKRSLDISYETVDGKSLSKEHSRNITPYDIYREKGGSVYERHTVDGIRTTRTGGERELVRTSNHGRSTFDLTEDESLFGLGSHEEGFPSIKGHYIPLYQENMRIAVPYFVSSKGYAYLFDCTSLMTFDATDERHAHVYFDSVDAIDYYFIYGGSYDGACRRYRALTGETPMLPRWACGYIQSKERYVDANDLVSVVEKYRRENIPLDAIIQDWFYWDTGLWGNKHFDAERYPDPKAMADRIHKHNTRLMISIWPNMSGDSCDRREFMEAGKLLSDGSVYDAFDPEAREMYWNQANEGLFKYGIDGWWCDSSEPYDATWHGKERPVLSERMKLSVGEFKKYIDDSLINAYSLEHSRGMYENQRKHSEKRMINLTRSGFSGQHRYGTISWSGDISATWESLARQVHIAQNFIACGEAYWNADIGGFFVRGGREWFRDGDYRGGIDDYGFRELYTRWIQFACFTPFFRSHGTDTPREVYRFGERGEMFRDAVEDAIKLRYELLPYFYSVNAAVTFDGTMPIAPLALRYPDDREAHRATDEYMYGNEFLVCPVTRPMYYGPESTPVENADRSRWVYLPRGGWYDYRTEKYYEGGSYYKIECDIKSIPVFVRAGSVVPTAAPVEYSDQLKDAVYEMRVYTGADGEFTLYDDEGDGYGYEKGEYTAIKVKYNDKRGEITEKCSANDLYRHKLIYRKITKK